MLPPEILVARQDGLPGAGRRVVPRRRTAAIVDEFVLSPRALERGPVRPGGDPHAGRSEHRGGRGSRRAALVAGQPRDLAAHLRRRRAGRVRCDLRLTPARRAPMHILWLKTELLHPLDKGGRIRTYEMLRRAARPSSRHVPHARRRHDHARAARAGRRVLRRPRAACRCAARRCKGWRRVLRRSCGNVVSSLPFAVAPYRSAGDDATRSARAARWRDRADVVVCDFLVAGAERARRAALPRRALPAQRRGDDLGAAHARGRATPSCGSTWASSGGGCGASSASSACASTTSSPSRREDAAVMPRAVRRRSACRRCRPAWTPTSSVRRAPCRSEPGDDRLHRLDGLDAERGRRWSGSWTRSCRGRARACPSVDADDRGPQSRRARVTALAEGRPRVDVTGTVPDVRPYLERGGGRRRPAARRRGHAAQDLRGDGDGARRGLDDDRRRGARRARRQAHRARRRRRRASPTPSIALLRSLRERPRGHRPAPPPRTCVPTSAGPRSPSSSPRRCLATAASRSGRGRFLSCHIELVMTLQLVSVFGLGLRRLRFRGLLRQGGTRRRRRGREPVEGRHDQRREEHDRRGRHRRAGGRDGARAGRLRATTDVADAVRVDRRSRSSASARRAGRTAASTCSYIERVCAEIGAALRDDRPVAHGRDPQHGAARARSTDVVIPALERASGKKFGQRLRRVQQSRSSCARARRSRTSTTRRSR